MPSGFRGRRGGSSHSRGSNRGRGRGPGRGARGQARGRGNGRITQTSTFNSSRARDVEDSESIPEEAEAESATEDDISQEDELASEDDGSLAQPYTSLLQALQRDGTSEGRPNKRRKTSNEHEHGKDQNGQSATVDDSARPTIQNVDDDVEVAGLTEQVGSDMDGEDIDSEKNDTSDEEEGLYSDPFERHFAGLDEQQLNLQIEQRKRPPVLERSKLLSGTRKIRNVYGDASGQKSSQRSLKGRLKEAGTEIIQSLNPEERDVFQAISNYSDVIYGCRSYQNSEGLRDMACLHILDHIFRTRDRVLKNNAKLSQNADMELDLRDQGFTRPKILVVLPTKESCVRYVNSIVRLAQPDQQENRSRFLDTFSQPDDDTFDNKPEDFQELFAGNHEEDFRLGLKFTRKTIKFFSGFYNSDIIFASALGMMRTITTGGGAKDAKKVHDADFLSSIEVVIVDNASAIEMQNWQHLEYVFSQLNGMPKDSHGCDFSRVRNWYLDGNANYLRQTIVFSEFITPQITSLVNTHAHNIDGMVRYTPVYSGAILNLPPSLPITLTQSFLRFEASQPAVDSDARFKFFTTTVLPTITRKGTGKGTLIFVPTYLDFVRLRNYFSTAAETTSLTFGTLSEYSSKSEVGRARAHFTSGRHSMLVYTERAHHYFRYKLKGVRRVLFYGLPENLVFWTEILEMVASNASTDAEWRESLKGKQGKGLIRAIFSKWDVMKLERIVGTERVGRLLQEGEGDVYDFV